VSSASAVGDAFQRVASGELDLVIAGGAECPLQEDIVGTFEAAGILADATEDDPCCRPFDARHSGTSLGEGAGILILESEEHARARGANCRAILRGYGMCAEDYSMIAPDPEGSGVERAVRQALMNGGADRIASVDWIKTHGTGTARNDAAECRGLARVWPERFASMPLTSIKPILGHCLGASGAVEAVACLLAMEEELIPSLVDCDVADSELPPCSLVRAPERRRTESVLLLSESFGGRCAALHLERRGGT
jgi:3-oxoacyl-[acyl-carrier-protein] synthase II